MTILEHDTVDMAAWDAPNARPVLGISDHLSWDDVNHHLRALTKKIDTYVQFVNSGQLHEQYPQYSGGTIEFRIYLKEAPPATVVHFYDELQKMVTRLNSNIELNFKSAGEGGGGA